MVRRGLVVLMAGAACASIAVRAGTPNAVTFTYQGQLKQDGVPYSGSADFEVDVFAAPDGDGPTLGNLRLLDVAVENGLFSLDLSFDSSFFDGSPRWLEIAVRTPHDPADLAAFTEFDQRQPVRPAPYAIHAFNVPSIEETNWRNNGANVHLPNGNVGIGTSLPTSMLHLQRPYATTAIRFQSARFDQGAPGSAVRAGSSATTSGEGASWNAPSASLLADDAWATTDLSEVVGLPDADQSRFLDLTAAGFALPADAQVTGFTVQTEGHGIASCSGCEGGDVILSLDLLGGSGASTIRSVGLSPTDSGFASGGTFDTWGLDWTPQQVNDSAFGVRISANLVLGDLLCVFGGCARLPCDCAGNGTGFVDAVTITVHFFAAPTTSTQVDWTVGRSEQDLNFRIAATPDLSTPVLTITPQGSLGVGTTDFSNGFFKLAVNGPAAKPNGGQWSALSDARLKRNIEPLSGALSRLLRLRGVTFEFTEVGIATGLAQAGRHAGFVAQEVEPVFPEWVGEGGGYKFVTEEGTTALLVEALRELRAEKDSQLKELTERLERLERDRATLPVSP